jgi:diadenosine tetraphosphate (Ap4A) HIT family hydrolase/8-oxo-dGTP pyrophosphatase MutT (NUDIX family)
MKITQEIMKNARVSGDYEKIWTTRGKCVFCDLNDKYIVYEENGIVLTISLYPYIDGHLIAIPREHVTSPKQLKPAQWETFRKFNYLAKKIVRKVHGHKSMWSLLREGGVNAQMTVSDHLHMHFIPFDKKDLCQWNYRELKFTPLQNVAEYRKAVKNIQKVNSRYERKYKHAQRFPIVADLLVANKNRQVLVAERTSKTKFLKNYWNIPGGHIDDPKKGILGELKREMQEELNYDFDMSKVKLVNSEISTMTYANKSKHLKANMPINHWFLWNVYLLPGFDDVEKLKPGDDTKRLIWLDIDKIKAETRLTPGARKVISKAAKLIKSD